MAKTYKINIFGQTIEIPEYIISKYSDEQLRTVLETYLTENPITGTLTEEETVSLVNTAVQSAITLTEVDDGTEIEPLVTKSDVLSLIKENVTNAVNTIDSPFETAYWKDALTSDVYLVTITNGELVITKKSNSNDDDETIVFASTVTKSLKSGINIGNSLEAMANTNERYEYISASTDNADRVYRTQTMLGNPITTKDMIVAIKDAGFEIVRIPVTWYLNMTDGVINVEWLERVSEIISWVLDEGMYCIVNLHHDTRGTSAKINANPTSYDNSSEYLKNVWAQLAEYFKDYSYKLFFEGFNEVTADTYDIDAVNTVNKLNQDFIDTVRSSGGKNSKRNLLITTYDSYSSGIALTNFTMPTDTTDNHVIVRLHLYPSTVSDISGLFTNMNTYLLSKNIPTIITEFGLGAYDQTEQDLELLTEMRNECDTYNVCPIVWDDNGSYKKLIRLLDKWYNPSAISILTGKTLEENTWSYPCTTGIYTNYAKFYTDNDMNGESRYYLIISESPITGITSDSTSSTAYYTANFDNYTKYVVFTSTDGEEWVPLTNKFNTKYVMPYTTEITLLNDCNYTITGWDIKELSSCKSLSLDNETLTFTEYGYQTLIATINPSNCTDVITWSTSDSSVATFSKKSVTNTTDVYGVGNGTATITITCGEKSATCQVIVSGIESIEWDTDWTAENDGNITSKSNITVDNPTYYNETLKYVYKSGNIKITDAVGGDSILEFEFMQPTNADGCSLEAFLQLESDTTKCQYLTVNNCNVSTKSATYNYGCGTYDYNIWHKVRIHHHDSLCDIWVDGVRRQTNIAPSSTNWNTYVGLNIPNTTVSNFKVRALRYKALV